MVTKILIIVFILFTKSLCIAAETSIEEAIDKGANFLNDLYDPEFIFDDPYIKCIGQLPGSDLYFRMLDTSIFIHYFFPKKEKLRPEILAKTKEIVAECKEKWRFRKLSLDIPVDLYSVFVYFHPDETKFMFSQIKRKLDKDGNFEPYEFYPEDFQWRKVADEVWPIWALAKNKVKYSLLKKALDRKKKEAEWVIEGKWKDKNLTFKYYTVISAYNVFITVGREGYDLKEYSPLIKKLEKWLVKIYKDPQFQKYTVYLSDTLYWLCLGNYSDRKFLKKVAEDLLKRQERDGGWRAHTLKIGEKTISGTPVTKLTYDTGRALATNMSILSLYTYRNLIK